MKPPVPRWISKSCCRWCSAGRRSICCGPGIAHVAEEVAADKGWTPSYTVGTMIELPRAALAAGSIAESADFFSLWHE